MAAGKALAIANIALSVCVAIGYAFAGDTRRAIYWASAAILTSTVTF